jgi:DNA replicative helicase MCM subunit Mcm2 (Cdc46/Mcm family)
MHRWDADDRDQYNDLERYFQSLTRMQKKLIKGLVKKPSQELLMLDKEEFLKLLRGSLTLEEIGKLSDEELEERQILMDEIMVVWRSHKNVLEQDKVGLNQEIGHKNEQEAKGWMPKHHDLHAQDRKRVHSVTEAARLHEGKDVSVIGVISGIQPLRKMIKGVSVQCWKCNTVYERKYDKPELFESFVPIEKIRKCQQCNTGEYLGRYEWENINAVVVELKDHGTFSEINPLRIIVFGDDEPAFDDTRNIDRHIGETIIVTGDIYNVDIGKGRRESRVVAYLYVKYLVKYLSKQELELTAEDEKAIKRFVDHIGPDKVIERLTEMFATSVIGHNHVKRGLLLVAASTSLNKTVKKLNAILVGPPGLAKSQLLKEATRLVPNSRYESVQFATGKSLTVIVTKEEGDALILRIGPIPQAKGAIAALNEIGRMTHEDQGLMLDTMQEQEFTTNKFGQNFHVDAPTAIIASANPVGGSWKSYDRDGGDKIDLDKIPMIKPLIDRFDLIFTPKDNTSEEQLAEYADRKSEMEDKATPDYMVYIAKHIMYAKQRCPKPKFSEEAKAMLNQYYVSVRSSYGSPRILETIYAIAMNIARLKLKHIVDAADAIETMQFYNVILQQLDMIVTLPSNPRDITYEECFKVLKELAFPISYEEVVRMACERNVQVARYVDGKGRRPNLKLRYNKKLRPVLEMLEDHTHVKIIQTKPVVLQYVDRKADTSGQACDLCDQCDLPTNTTAKNLEGNSSNSVNISSADRNKKAVRDSIKTTKNISQLPDSRAHKSHRSQSITAEIEEPILYSCYHKGCNYHTDDVQEYERHGAQKHLKNPLLYPSKAEIEKYGLKAQGKDWEI